MAGFGVSFLPDGLGEDAGTDEQAKGAQFQRAIQLLQLRIPRVHSGGASLAPAALLNAPGSMGVNPDTAMMQQAILAMAGRPMGNQPQAAPVSPMSAPRAARTPIRQPQSSPRTLAPSSSPATPRVIPGIDTLPGPLPQGPVQQQWNSPLPVPEPPPAPTGGASSPMQNKYDWIRQGYRDPQQL